MQDCKTENNICKYCNHSTKYHNSSLCEDWYIFNLKIELNDLESYKTYLKDKYDAIKGMYMYPNLLSLLKQDIQLYLNTGDGNIEDLINRSNKVLRIFENELDELTLNFLEDFVNNNYKNPIFD